MGYFIGFNFGDMPSVGTYEKALAVWNHPKRIKRTSSDGFRPLRIGDRKASRTKMHMASNGDIMFRLYDTDVVTYHPDNSITVESYCSKTTQEFANELLPPGLRLDTQYMSKNDTGPYMWSTAGTHNRYTDAVRSYKFNGSLMRLRYNGTHWIPDTAMLITEPRVNVSKRAKVWRTFRLNDYRKFLDAVAAHQVDVSPRYAPLNMTDLHALLAAGDFAPVARSQFDRFNELVEVLFCTHKVIDVTEHEYVRSYVKLQQIHSLQRKWRGYY